MSNKFFTLSSFYLSLGLLFLSLPFCSLLALVCFCFPSARKYNIFSVFILIEIFYTSTLFCLFCLLILILLSSVNNFSYISTLLYIPFLFTFLHFYTPLFLLFFLPYTSTLSYSFYLLFFKLLLLLLFLLPLQFCVPLNFSFSPPRPCSPLHTLLCFSFPSPRKPVFKI